MRFRKQRGPAFSLVLAGHPLSALVTTVALTVAAALTGRSGRECLLVAATVLVGQLTVGWVDDVVDRERDAQVGRSDRPVARGWVDPGTVTFATACATLVVIPLSIANGTAAGIAYLAALVSIWTYHLYLKRTVLSWLPFAVSFGLLPVFLSYGGLGGGLHGGPPTVALTVLAALLGVGVHFLTALPDLVQDNESGVRHLPLRVALRTGAPRLLWISTASTVLVAAGLVIAALTVGLRM
jgi:4-hydroxybenzoate polyprenyltransferase